MSEEVAEGAPQTARYATGAMFGVSAVTVWATWLVVTRLGVTTTLSVYDLTMLRFGAAGLLLFPIVLRKGLALEWLGPLRLLILVCSAGAPYVLVAASGLRLAPVAHAGALLPGSMPLFVALLSFLLTHERFAASRLIGYALIAIGGAAIAGPTAVSFGDTQIGHILLLVAAFIWAGYAIVLRASGLDSLHAAALVSTGSLILYGPVYLAFHGLHGMDAPLRDIVIQTLFQGVMVSIVALFLFGKGIELLGASAGAAFSALVPPMAALIAIPLLGETPSLIEQIALLCVSLGVYLASGGRAPSLRIGRRG
ncbi:DMT family transporter [Methylosinus sp. KRF6]|uniref:DMT family transporter n=1 Tax=Methylosinus sp. KRF6 TaxID=2846853 RepID=UPI001C0AB9E5|nr:DMT family transporter [Methylosinus sp. KRF6]MBU3888128.1 DMT family transporter [Methylosinus sp. KRF6]